LLAKGDYKKITKTTDFDLVNIQINDYSKREIGIAGLTK
jgi:hypothetical protein